jgi:hypothetical protein
MSTDGIEFPCHVAILAANGSGYIARLVANDCTFLAEHEEPMGYMLPVHALFMDSTGYTARIIIRPRSKGA